tara:strand:- start:7796 stop:9349 length:1554 start_codon:yes stop_codon:yes gene_type:complete
MALINSLQHTTLKDFPKYSGRQPFIRKDIKNPPVYNTVSSAVQSRGDDVLRLGKLMLSGPGVKFLGNTAALNAIDRGRAAAPPQRDRKNDGGGTGSTVGDVLAFLGTLISGVAVSAANAVAVTASTISQAGLSGTGTHLVLGFKGKQGYLRRVQGHVISSEGGEVPIPVDFVSELANGDSKTFIQTKLKFPNRYDAAKFSYDQGRNGVPNPLDVIANQLNVFSAETVGGSERKLYDFTSNTYKEIDAKIQKEKRLGLPQTGGRGKTRYTSNYSEALNLEASDKIGMLGPQLGENEDANDFIKFNFEVISQDEGEQNVFLYFRAYLDAFSDSYTGTWSDHTYYGRAEKFYTYGGFERSISFGFKAYADTRDALKPMYQKLNYLASTTAPTYDTNQSFMRGTLCNITIGDYLVSQPGFFSAVNFSWEQGYPWEIKLKNNEPVQQLPHLLNCEVEFTPIHKFAPQTGLYHYSTNPNENKYFSSGEEVTVNGPELGIARSALFGDFDLNTADASADVGTAS